jgi:hypothetical protein
MCQAYTWNAILFYHQGGTGLLSTSPFRFRFAFDTFTFLAISYAIALTHLEINTATGELHYLAGLYPRSRVLSSEEGSNTTYP